MKHAEATRRNFIVAAIALSGTAASLSVLRPIRAWAEESNSALPNPGMARMARLLYPHDALSDDIYSEILGAALAATAADDSFAVLLADVGDALDSQTGGNFVTADEASQIAAMQSIEGHAAFNIIQAKVQAGVYQHPACWKAIGYGGPSFQAGGYLNRGVGEIDWLPEVE
jgi:hypothetical protein